jgi:hypothetical protein
LRYVVGVEGGGGGGGGMLGFIRPGGATALLPGKIVILFAVSVTKVKCISRSKVLLQRQVKIYYWE